MNPGLEETKQQSAEVHAARETENTVAIPNVLRIPDVPNAPDVPRIPGAPDVPDAPQPRRKGAKKGILIAVIVISIMACGGLVAFLLLEQRKPATELELYNETTIQERASSAEADLQEEPQSSGPWAVAEEYEDAAASDSCVTEAWESITLSGTMTDMNGAYPIELTFEKEGDSLTNCIYTNVDLGGKIKMEGETAGSELVFTGKDGMYKFQIRIDRDTFDGTATDGPKELSVSLERKY